MGDWSPNEILLTLAGTEGFGWGPHLNQPIANGTPFNSPFGKVFNILWEGLIKRW